MEAAIIERLRRNPLVELHPEIMNAPLIYDDAGKQAMYKIYEKYLNVSKELPIPFVICTPTWRTNKERVMNSSFSLRINQDAVQFMKEIRSVYGKNQSLIKIGGLLGCKNDCYKPEEGLSAFQAEVFHAWQIESLKEGEVDFLFASTLPNVDEALGIANAMSATSIPYMLSFVINRKGEVLDSTPLHKAVQWIDDNVSNPPLGYLCNCSYPTFLCAEKQPPELFKRLIGYQANASSLDHAQLEGSNEVKAESVQDWTKDMWDLHEKYGLKILGGCCGTGTEHLRALANKYHHVI